MKNKRTFLLEEIEKHEIAKITAWNGAIFMALAVTIMILMCTLIYVTVSAIEVNMNDKYELLDSGEYEDYTNSNIEDYGL